ncbi:hypothetical protein BVX95_01700, partial [archaeon D22]
LGEEDLRVANAIKGEEYIVNTADTEFLKFLNYLSPKASIFLNSCSNGSDAGKVNNFANFTNMESDGKIITSSKVPFAQRQIKVRRFYPLMIEIDSYSASETYQPRKT